MLRLLRKCILADKVDEATLHEVETYSKIMGL